LVTGKHKVTEVDREGRLIQMMSELLEKNKEERTFLQRLYENIPGVLVSLLLGAFAFYVFAQVNFAVMEEKMKQGENWHIKIDRQFDRFEDRMEKLEARIRELEKEKK
jgi:hypothetical protein